MDSESVGNYYNRNWCGFDILNFENKKMETKTRIINGIKMFFKIIGWTLGIILGIIVLFFIYINLPVKDRDTNTRLGVTFSSRYAQDIGLDWKQAYIAMLDDIKVRSIRIPIYWDLVEKDPGQYDFTDLDWQLDQAAQRNAKIILVVGRKVPRWPECFIPKWAGDDTNVQQEKLLAFEDVVIRRYKDNHPEIVNWQVENEPFLDFGVCPKVDNAALLDAEIAKVKSIDSTRPILVTDSGEISPWIQAAKRGDIFGTTMYREVYSSRKIFGRTLGHWTYPIGPNFFKVKQLIIKLFAHQNNAIVIELQGEPWVQGWTVHAPLDVQLASMNADKLAENVQFAKNTGMKEVYIWGVEWWFWMKVSQGNSTLWNEAKRLFSSDSYI
jgi:hypothetical protein